MRDSSVLVIIYIYISLSLSFVVKHLFGVLVYLALTPVRNTHTVLVVSSVSFSLTLEIQSLSPSDLKSFLKYLPARARVCVFVSADFHVVVVVVVVAVTVTVAVVVVIDERASCRLSCLWRLVFR